MTSETNSVSSIRPPLIIGPWVFFFSGQNGWMPSFVNESQIKWTEYPKKKPKLANGQKNATASDSMNAVVML